MPKAYEFIGMRARELAAAAGVETREIAHYRLSPSLLVALREQAKDKNDIWPIQRWLDANWFSADPALGEDWAIGVIWRNKPQPLEVYDVDFSE